jgi:hypothetical protein
VSGFIPSGAYPGVLFIVRSSYDAQLSQELAAQGESPAWPGLTMQVSNRPLPSTSACVLLGQPTAGATNGVIVRFVLAAALILGLGQGSRGGRGPRATA